MASVSVEQVPYEMSRIFVIWLLLHSTVLSLALSTPARLLLEPVDTVVNGDESVVLNCAASRGPGDVQPKISWKRDGKLISGASILANGSLYLNQDHAARARDEEGQYQCVAIWPAVGSLLSRSAKLQSAWLAHFDEEPQESNIVVLGQTARFACSTQGQPPPQVHWIKDDTPLRMDPFRMTLLPSGTLEIRGVQVGDGGLYKCNVSNTDRSLLSKTGRLSIGLLSGRKGDEMAPVFTVLPKSQTALIPSSSVLFECSAVGHPLPSISWLKDGITLPLNSSQVEGAGRVRRLGHGNLFIESVMEGDRGTYQCRAENSEDSVDVSATLQVQVAPKAEVRDSLLYSHEKEDVDLECGVVGSPPPSVQWFKNADMISEGDYFQLDNNGLTLRILGLVASDSGLYQCIATNPAGNAQAAVQLVVLKAGQSIPNSNTSFGPRTPTTTSTSSSGERLGPPRDLQASGVTSQSVTLSWKTASSNAREVVGYAVYYKELDSDRERVLNITAPAFEQVYVQGLQSNKKYSFRVVAYSSRGFGDSSRPLIVSTQPQQEAETPSAPTFLRAWPISSTSVAVEWAPPVQPPSSQHADTPKYKVYYTELPNEQLAQSPPLDFSGRRNRLQKTQTASAPETLLEDLRVFTEYSVAVAAINRQGREGPKSRPVRVLTLSEAPADTPHNFGAEAASSVSIAVVWDPPSPEFQNGVITGYKLKYKVKGRKKAATLTTDANVKATTLSGLERATEYQLKIAALNINGSGPFTEWISAMTFAFDLSEDVVPDKPGSLYARPQATSIVLSWTPPRNGNVLVRGYTIGWGRGIPDVYTKLVDGKKRSFTLDTLQPKTDYVISLRAFNLQGDGVPIYENVRTKDQADEPPPEEVGDRRLSPPVGLRALTLSSSAIRLQWTDSAPLSSNRFVSEPFDALPRASYVVKFVPVDEGTQSPRSAPGMVNTTESSVTVQSLEPGTLYEFSVKAVLRASRQSSEWSLVTANKTFAEEQQTTTAATTVSTEGMRRPQDVTLLALTNAVGISSVVINWQPPPTVAMGIMDGRGGEEVLGYVIRYTTNPSLSEWMEEAAPEDVLTHQVYGLTPDTTYYFQLTAKYVTHSSDPTGVKSVRTPPLRAQERTPEGGTVQSRASNELVLYLLIALSLLFAMASLALCLYYRNRGTDSSAQSPTKHSQGSLTKKGGREKTELNPPDLWIHHDRMELKGVRTRTRHDSSPLDASHAFGGEAEEKEPLQQPNYSSLKKQHGYALSSPSSYASNEPKYPTLGKTTHYGSSIASESSTNTNASLNQHPDLQGHSNTLSRRQMGGGVGAPGGANLKSFAVPLPPPLHSTTAAQPLAAGGGRQFSSSPVRRISTSNIPNIIEPLHYASPPNHLNNMGNMGQMGVGVGGDEPPLQKCYSTEELSLEISNLEGLMKDLNAITANEFQC